MSTTLRRTSSLVALVLALTCLRAQDVPLIRVRVRLVEVAATVFDSHGHFVDGLKPENFHIMEDGKLQAIKDFQSDAQSMHCAVLLDTTGSMDAALPGLKNAVSGFIDQLGPTDSVSIYTFAEQLNIQQDFTTDKVAAKRAVLRLRAGGGTALFDALSQAAQEVSTQQGKKAIIVFTDGDDNASVLNAATAINRAKKNGIPLFTIAEGEATKSPKFRKLLADLSTATGGATYDAADQKNMQQVFQKISGDLRHIYLLSYQPPPGPSDGSWRKIDVAVDGVKDYRVRAREGYLPN
jgi:VWFA-related protein